LTKAIFASVFLLLVFILFYYAFQSHYPYLSKAFNQHVAHWLEPRSR